MSEEKTFVNEHEAAKIVGLCVSALRSRRARKCPPIYYKVGRSVFYDVSELKEFITAVKVLPKSVNNGK